MASEASEIDEISNQDQTLDPNPLDRIDQKDFKNQDSESLSFSLSESSDDDVS